MGDDLSNKSIGDALELSVMEHYRAIGFKVTQNILIEQHQIDILAEKYIRGGTIYKIMVEVKSRSSSLGINDISNFISAATRLIQCGQVQSAVVVTNAKVSASAKAALRGAQINGIKIISLKDLQSDILDLQEPLIKKILGYESDDIFQNYISLASETNYGLSINDTADYLLKHINDDCMEFLVISGDFGSGKTTIMDRIFYEQAKLFVRNQTTKFPIQVKLTNLLNYTNIWSFVEKEAYDNQYLNISREALQKYLQRGDLVLLLDGFDEIYSGATAVDRANYLNKIFPLLDNRSPAVMSTRPTYFESFEQMITLFDASLPQFVSLKQVNIGNLDLDAFMEKVRIPARRSSKPQLPLTNYISIDGLSEAKIISYLDKHSDKIRQATNMNSEQVYKKLSKVYDLSDLMRRPIILEMIIANIIQRGFEFFGDDPRIGPSSVYEFYTQLCMLRDRRRSLAAKSVFDQKERSAISRMIALRCLQQGSSEITNQDLREALVKSCDVDLEQFRQNLDEANLEAALTEARLYTFIKFTAGGSFRFTHKSFAEFFVAQYINRHVKKKYEALLDVSCLNLSKEVIYFLASYAKEDSEFSHKVAYGIEFDLGTKHGVKELLMRIAFSSGMFLNGKTFQDCGISDLELKRETVFNSKWKNISFARILVSDAEFTDLEIVECSFIDVRFERVIFRGSNLSFLRGGVALQACFLQDTKLFVGHDSDLKDITLRGGELCFQRRPEAGITEALDFSARGLTLEIIDCKQVLIACDRLKGFGKMNFRGCRVASYGLKTWYNDQLALDFADTYFMGLFIDITDLHSLIQDSKNITRSNVCVKNCAGLLLTRDTYSIFDDESTKKFKDKFSDIDVIDVSKVERIINNVLRTKRAHASVASKVADAELLFLHHFCKLADAYLDDAAHYESLRNLRIQAENAIHSKN